MTLLTTATYLYRAPFVLNGTVELLAQPDEGLNRAPFRGVLTRLDEPSTRPPNGAQGHQVVIPRAVAQVALPSLVGMPINCSFGLREHDKKFVIGVIETPCIEGQDLLVAGYLLDKNYPAEVEEIRRRRAQLGMSYEISAVEVEDITTPVWVLTHLVFTGAAILLRDAAAYAKTAIAAHAEEEAFMPGDATAILTKLDAMGKQLETLHAAEDDATKKAVGTTNAETDAAKTAEATRKAEEDAARTKAEEDAARTKAEEGEEDAEAELLAMLLDGVEDEEDAEAELLANMMHRMLRRRKSDAIGNSSRSPLLAAMLKAMSYPGGLVRGRKRSAETAAHDDEPEDRALFDRLVRQYKKSGRLDAGRKPVDDLATYRLERKLDRALEAIGLITDRLAEHTGLITDLVHGKRNLATDDHRPNQGAPVRKTMHGTGEAWITKDDKAATADEDGKEGFTLAQINAALDKEFPLGGDRPRLRERLAKKVELEMAGKVKN